MNEKMKYWLSQVYKWRIKDGKPRPPKLDLPKFVIKRIKFFEDQNDNGLTFYGAFTAILAADEKQAKHDIEIGGGDWLPVSDEFRKWMHSDYFVNTRQMIIALALIYGWSDDDIV